MEDTRLPGLQKSTSFDATLPEKQNHVHPTGSSKYRGGSFPQLPQGNPAPKRGRLIKKHSCFDRYHDQPVGLQQRKVLYDKVLSLIEEMVANPAKFELLLSALQSMENSVKNARKSKGSLDANKSNRRNLKHKQSQGSIEGAHGELSQNSAVSLKLSESGEETPLGSKPPLLPNCTEEIYEYMAESIEIEYPYESDMIVGEKGDKGDKVSNAESEEIMQFSAARSIQQQMIESLQMPELTDMYKRISLLLVEDVQGEGSDLCSSASSAAPQFPSVGLSIQLVTALFQDASPLLMNLALSLLFKFMLRSKVRLDSGNAGWLLGLSALVGYKIFYDETLQGILEYFAGVLRVGAEQAARLQRWFLGELNYEVLINNKHYTEIMIKLLGNL